MCQLPSSGSRRGALNWATLLERVDPDARDGFGFHGRRLKPGARIAVAELGLRPVLLESTQGELSYETRRQGSYRRLYILWRYDHFERAWIEIARTQSLSSDWAAVLASPARMALERLEWEPAPEVSGAAKRIRETLDTELAAVGPHEQKQILAELHDEIEGRTNAVCWRVAGGPG